MLYLKSFLALALLSVALAHQGPDGNNGEPNVQAENEKILREMSPIGVADPFSLPFVGSFINGKFQRGSQVQGDPDKLGPAPEGCRYVKQPTNLGTQIFLERLDGQDPAGPPPPVERS